MPCCCLFFNQKSTLSLNKKFTTQKNKSRKVCLKGIHDAVQTVARSECAQYQSIFSQLMFNPHNVNFKKIVAILIIPKQIGFLNVNISSSRNTQNHFYQCCIPLTGSNISIHCVKMSRFVILLRRMQIHYILH